MSDTPETDKEWRHPASFDGSERVVHISVAQKRERERDEAREELAEAKREAENLAKSIYRSEYSDNDTDWELLDSVAGVISQIDNMYAGVREQRDEAREEAGHWKTEYEIVVDRLRGRKHPRDNGIIADDEIIPKLERERDEAREELNQISEYGTDEINAAVELRQKLAQTLIERDEALKFPAWIPVAQALPDDDATVLIHLADGGVEAGFLDAGAWRFVSGDRTGTPVLHWRPFPDAPQISK